MTWLNLKLWALDIDARLPRGWKTAVVAIALAALAVHYADLRWSTPAWLVTKLLAGAFVGYLGDRMGFPNDRPHTIDDPDLKQAAWRRRSVIIGAAMVAAGVSA